jgi:two-component system, NarL family, nitrate/nitrite response regulator NarL
MPINGSLRVLVVDDHIGIRTGISSLIDAEQPHMVTVGTAATAADALAQTFALQPDVVVLDVNLGGEDGLALIPALHRAAPCEVVVLTSLADPRVAAHAHRLGARACLHKTAPAAELLVSILTARRIEPMPMNLAPGNGGVVLSHALGSKRPFELVNGADGPATVAP